jgi:hypothetical protein
MRRMLLLRMGKAGSRRTKTLNARPAGDLLRRFERKLVVHHVNVAAATSASRSAARCAASSIGCALLGCQVTHAALLDSTSTLEGATADAARVSSCSSGDSRRPDGTSLDALEQARATAAAIRRSRDLVSVLRTYQKADKALGRLAEHVEDIVTEIDRQAELESEIEPGN